jgi:diacylglycerol kinase
MTGIIKSFRFAFDGLAYAFRNEKNFRVHCIIALLVVVAMLVLPLDIVERALLLMMIMAVLVLELVNTALERAMDVVQPDIHPTVKIVKDVMASAVLLGAVFSVLIGVLIFLPHIAAFLSPNFPLY